MEHFEWYNRERPKTLYLVQSVYRDMQSQPCYGEPHWFLFEDDMIVYASELADDQESVLGPGIWIRIGSRTDGKLRSWTFAGKHLEKGFRQAKAPGLHVES